MEVVGLSENFADLHTESPETNDRESGWENCPLDILLMVFEKLEPEDLMNCILVNECWRDAVDYSGQHRGIWRHLAQAGMVNRGITFRRRSRLSWRHLYLNSRLWRQLRHARLAWSYELSEHDVRYLHVFKDILIVESEEIFLKKYYRIGQKLDNITETLMNSCSDDNEASPRQTAHGNIEECSARDSDRMIRKLVQEGPFKRLLVIDEESFYLIDSKNVLRYFKWDDPYQRWLDYTLARYYGCNKSISDINVYNDEVYILLKTGLVFRLDKAGRNFVPEHRFGLTQSRVIEMSRLIYPNVLKRIEHVSSINVPNYSTGRNVMFHKLNAAVSVPPDKEFKMTVDKSTGSVVLEYPGLTSAAQHGELLFLGFKDGTIEICLPKTFGVSDPSGIKTNVKYCKDFKDRSPEIVALDVHENERSHDVFVATHSSVYRLTISYPDRVREAIGLKS